MQRILPKTSKSIVFSLTNLFAESRFLSNPSSKHCLTTVSRHRKVGNPQREAIPGDFLKWVSLGFVRTSRFASGFSPLQPKPLDSIMDLERAKTKSPEDLALIWDDYHLGRGHIGLTMKAKLYNLLVQRSTECRFFVIPLWRGSGYTTMFAQGVGPHFSKIMNAYSDMPSGTKQPDQMPHMVFTGLEDYKSRGTQASPYFTSTFFTEFAESKDLVLIRGDVVFTSKLTDDEAKWILETTQSFYLNDSKYKLVEMFNKQTHDFEFKDVLRALELPIL